ncbi:kinase-like domain-containing protein [Xylaria sp. FL0043]|nr:kinase-like domain-containing protein [Xylaria sp. FL0043]
MEIDKKPESPRTSHVNDSISIEKDIQQADNIQEYEYNYLMQQQGVEPASKYNRGGFHPIHLADVLNDRYEVIHKLGSGGFGTVWLCRDRQMEKWRAIKVMTADHSFDSAEAKAFEFLTKNCSLDELDQNHIAVPLDSFWVQGPNGRHLCLVMQLYGFPVSDWRRDQDDIDPSTKEKSTEICGQITQALAFLHEKGLCHGDFRPSNILMMLDQDALQEIDAAQMDDLLGEAEAWEIRTSSGESPRPKGPDYCVVPVSQKWCEKLLVPEIAVVDFGESYFTNNPRKATGIPTYYAAPEVLISHANGVSVDLWSLACTICEVRTDEPLFGDNAYFGGSFDYNTFNRVIRQMIAVLGPPPEPYRTAWKYGKKESDSSESADSSSADGDLQKSDRTEDSKCSDTLKVMLGAEKEQYPSYFSENRDDPPTKYQYEREEVLLLADLLEKLLQYDPEKRLGAKSVLQHPWLQHTAASRKSHSDSSGSKGCYMTRFWGMFWDLS